MEPGSRCWARHHIDRTAGHAVRCVVPGGPRPRPEADDRSRPYDHGPDARPAGTHRSGLCGDHGMAAPPAPAGRRPARTPPTAGSDRARRHAAVRRSGSICTSTPTMARPIRSSACCTSRRAVHSPRTSCRSLLPTGAWSTMVDQRPAETTSTRSSEALGLFFLGRTVRRPAPHRARSGHRALGGQSGRCPGQWPGHGRHLAADRDQLPGSVPRHRPRLPVRPLPPRGRRSQLNGSCHLADIPSDHLRQIPVGWGPTSLLAGGLSP